MRPGRRERRDPGIPAGRGGGVRPATAAAGKKGLNAAGEGVRGDRAPEDVGRAREQEASRPPILVDRPLEGQDEFRRALDLVDHRTVETPHKAGWIAPSGGAHGFVIQAQERPARIADLAGERRLPGLPWPDDGDDTGVLERLPEAGLGVAGERCVKVEN